MADEEEEIVAQVMKKRTEKVSIHGDMRSRLWKREIDQKTRVCVVTG